MRTDRTPPPGMLRAAGRPARRCRRLGLLVTLLAVIIALVAACGSGSSPKKRADDPSAAPAKAALRSSGSVAPHPEAAPARVAPGPTVVPKLPQPPAPDPCAGNAEKQLVKVSLRRQHLWMCARTRLAYSTPITSGIVGQYTHTPTGTYRIQAVNRNTTLTLNTGQQYRVKYWIPFDAPLFGFHDAHWQTFPFGAAKYKTDGSHGCVHMPLKAIAYLAKWVHVGATVVKIKK